METTLPKVHQLVLSKLMVIQLKNAQESNVMATKEIKPRLYQESIAKDGIHNPHTSINLISTLKTSAETQIKMVIPFGATLLTQKLDGSIVNQLSSIMLMVQKRSLQMVEIIEVNNLKPEVE
jgi:hypothetical protein